MTLQSLSQPKELAACKKAGIAGRRFHDFRRTAARDMTRAGVQETVAMAVTGHKSRSIFQRYNITDTRDVAAALASTQEYQQSQQGKSKVRAFPKK